MENRKTDGGERSETARRGFLRKLIGAALGAGMAGLLFGREAVKPAYAANTFPADGKVGIGTNTPQAALVVARGGPPEASFLADDDNVLALYGGGYAYFKGRDVTNNIEFANGTSVYGESFTGSMTNHAFSIRTNNTRRIYVTNAGNVGIGTTDPGTNRLRVASTGTRAIYASNSDSAYEAVRAENTGGGPAAVFNGRVTQRQEDYGLVKAAAYVNADGTVARSFNSQSAVTTVTKFGTGEYTVDFGFSVDNRYVLTTVVSPGGETRCIRIATFPSADQVLVVTEDPDKTNRDTAYFIAVF